MLPKIIITKVAGSFYEGHIWADDLTVEQLAVLGLKPEEAELLDCDGYTDETAAWVNYLDKAVKVNIDIVAFHESLNTYQAIHVDLEVVSDYRSDK